MIGTSDHPFIMDSSRCSCPVHATVAAQTWERPVSSAVFPDANHFVILSVHRRRASVPERRTARGKHSVRKRRAPRRRGAAQRVSSSRRILETTIETNPRDDRNAGERKREGKLFVSTPQTVSFRDGLVSTPRRRVWNRSFPPQRPGQPPEPTRAPRFFPKESSPKRAPALPALPALPAQRVPRRSDESAETKHATRATF